MRRNPVLICLRLLVLLPLTAALAVGAVLSFPVAVAEWLRKKGLRRCPRKN